MALDKTTLTSAIQDAMKANVNQAGAEAAANTLGTAIANAIDAFVKSGAVSFAEGTVTGTCAGPGSPLTLGAASNGSIS